MKTCDPDRLADLQRAMQLIVDAVAQLPDGRRIFAVTNFVAK